MSKVFPLRRGHVLLVAALNARGWTRYRLAAAVGCRFPVTARPLARERGVGPDLAARINAALDGAVPVDSWGVAPTKREAAVFGAAYAALLSRGADRLQPAQVSP